MKYIVRPSRESEQEILSRTFFFLIQTFFAQGLSSNSTIYITKAQPEYPRFKKPTSIAYSNLQPKGNTSPTTKWTPKPT